MADCQEELDCGEAEALIKYTVSTKDLLTYQKLYQNQVEKGAVQPNTTFQYAWCLVHSKGNTARQAIPLLEELFREGNEQMKRDCLFYLAVAHAKLKDYAIAKKHVQSFLSVEPTNSQAKELQKYIKHHMRKDGFTGMAIVGGAAVLGGAAAIAIGGLAIATRVGMAFARSGKSKPKETGDDGDGDAAVKNDTLKT